MLTLSARGARGTGVFGALCSRFSVLLRIYVPGDWPRVWRPWSRPWFLMKFVFRGKWERRMNLRVTLASMTHAYPTCVLYCFFFVSLVVERFVWNVRRVSNFNRTMLMLRSSKV